MKKKSLISNLCADYPVVCSLVAVLLLTVFSAFSMWQGREFYYLDTDCYTRWLRIVDWISGEFSWAEKVFPFTNCPNGEILHFTRINDVIWLICSLPFMPFLPIKEAIFAGGLIFSPIMFFLILTVLMLGLKKFIGVTNFKKTSLFIFAFAVIFLAKSMVLEFGRPDHHSLMLLIAAFVAVCLLNMSERKMLFAGMAAAMGIWASSAPEGMLLAYGALAILTLGVISYKKSFIYAQKYTLGLFVGVLLAFLINPPYGGYWQCDNTRLSIIHVVVCGLTYIVFALADYINPKKVSHKILLLGGGALLSMILVVFMFGQSTIFAPIYNAKIWDYFVPYISEMKPVLPSECIYLVLGALEILLLYRLFKRKKFGDMALYVLFFIYLPFAALVRRFLPYEILFYVMITAVLLSELFKHSAKSEKYRWATLGLIVVNLLFCSSFSYAVKPVHTTYPKLEGCALTDIFFAPQLIYKTGATTIGSPYHNNVSGISDTVAIFSLSDENLIKRKLDQRNIKFIIVPNKKADMQLEYLSKTPENSLYKTLVNGGKYDWLQNIGDTDGAYIFYEIIR